MDKYSITLTHLNNLFYKEADELQPLYEDLKTTRLAEAQIRIVLLQALKRGLTTGDFVAEIDTVRSECRDRKSYDQGNFAANFKNNKTLFDGEYSKDTTRIGLSEEGRAELAEIIKELQ